MKVNAKKLFVNGVLGLSVLFTNTAVSYGDVMRDYLDHLNVYGAGSTSFNGHNWFFGGGVSFSTPNANFTPFHIVPPSIDTNGCGGFNAIFGGFGYFNVDYLVKFLQQILQAAPGFAFQIALKTFCPQCAGVLNALTSLANQINALGGNSCAIDNAIASGVAGWIGKQFSTQLGSNGGPASGDTASSFLNAVNDTLSSFSNMIANLSSKIGGYAAYALISEFENEGLVGTALSQSYVPSAWFNYTEFAPLVRGLVGDISVVQPNSSSAVPVAIYIAPTITNFGNVLQELSDTSTSSITLTGVALNNGASSTTSITLTNPTVYYQNKYVHPLIQAIISKSGPTNALSYFPAPIVRLIDALSPYPEALMSLEQPLSEYLGKMAIASMLSQALRAGAQGVAYCNSLAATGDLVVGNQTNDTNFCGELYKSVANAYKTIGPQLAQLYTQAQADLASQVQMAINVARLTQYVQARYSNFSIVRSWQWQNSSGNFGMTF